jgi:hypothetical protein
MRPGSRVRATHGGTIAGLALSASLALTGCSVASGRMHSAGPARTGSVVTTSTDGAASGTHGPALAPSAVRPLALLPPAVPGVTWHPAGALVRGRNAVYVTTTGQIGMMWMDPALLRFRFIPGYAVPEAGPVLLADEQPATWLPLMVAAFNGGFKLSDGVGGYFYAGRVVRALRPGLAAMVITTTGELSVVRWGRERGTTSGVEVVRENLPLLVDSFRSRTAPADTARTWGLANGGLYTANRSALGELSDGALVFAFGADRTASQMADAMLSVHARTAMVLDMNKSWPGGFVYSHSGGGITGRRIYPTIWHDPSVYFHRFTKDFVVAMVRP